VVGGAGSQTLLVQCADANEEMRRIDCFDTWCWCVRCVVVCVGF
jgi:hypothetical protein